MRKLCGRDFLSKTTPDPFDFGAACHNRASGKMRKTHVSSHCPSGMCFAEDAATKDDEVGWPQLSLERARRGRVCQRTGQVLDFLAEARGVANHSNAAASR